MTANGGLTLPVIFLIQWLSLNQGILQGMIERYGRSRHPEARELLNELKRLWNIIRRQNRQIERGMGIDSGPFTINELAPLFRRLREICDMEARWVAAEAGEEVSWPESESDDSE